MIINWSKLNGRIVSLFYSDPFTCLISLISLFIFYSLNVTVVICDSIFTLAKIFGFLFICHDTLCRMARNVSNSETLVST